MLTVRLAFMRRLVDVFGIGCLLAIVPVIVLGGTGATGGGVTALIGVAIVAAVTFGAPCTFRLREEESGLVLVRLLVAKRYAWSEIRGLAMEFTEDSETGAHRVRLRVRLVDPPGRHWGPFLGELAATAEDRPRGVEPRALAELFALFGRRGLPVDRPEFANAVLSAHGLPPLPPPHVRNAPTGPVPEPGQAYADAPGIEEEDGYLANHRKLVLGPPRARRDYLLRAAALRDRVALGNGDADAEQVASALYTAWQLAHHDGVTVQGDVRGYVREQYPGRRRAG
ncbi:hypothetical protein [Streptomyces sp. NRRL S-350]|uniref:hypothetical protein n=1 Tax=Streptomyces sp. NRRL S-350 TaxID=1463902 RepID=UPI0004C03DDA|nr:hypothetical protein [Streptomyces sp. NRRL S-350]